jgi:hypothetical protein
MPSFKPKPQPKNLIRKKEKQTLDTKHSEIISNFDKEEGEIPKLQKEKTELKVKFKNAKNIDEQLDIKDKIIATSTKIKLIKQKRTKYYLNNSSHIFEYFEGKQNITKTADTSASSNIANKFFNINNNDTGQSDSKKDNVQKYFSDIDDNYININKFITNTDICRICNKGEIIPVEQEGVLVCNKCGNNFQYLIENEKPSYKEPPKEVCFYAYKRINHFREILAQFQAKETTQIPEDVLLNIKEQIKKERIIMSQFNNKKAKDILKKLGYNKYYEHIPYIKEKFGIKPPVMMPDFEERLCSLFMDIQAPYAKFCPDDRVNFLNYYYTVNKLCELLDKPEFLSYFPMLKDREKIIEQDEIWKKICNLLNWEYIPTTI